MKFLCAAYVILSLLLMGNAQAEACLDAPLPRLTLGESGQRFLGANNNIRSRPGLENSVVTANLGSGQIFEVIDGPVCADNFYWYKITDEDDETGWVAEGQGFIYWLQPSRLATAPITLTENVEFRSSILFTALLEPQTIPVVVSVKPDGTDLAKQAVIPGAFNVFVARDYNQMGFDNRYGSVVTLNIDGTNVREVNLLGEEFSYGVPVWSPDFNQIAFSVRLTEDNANDDLFVVSSDGLELRRLTETPASEFYPSWSPDARQIAYVRSVEGVTELMVMNVAGGEARTLATVTGYLAEPAWSPDGSRIDYALETGIVIIDLNGNEIARLSSDNGGLVGQLSWSPDGSTIAFQQRLNPESLNGHLFVADRDGRNMRQLTSYEIPPLLPGWSPDGTQLAFYGEAPDNFLTTIQVDGSGEFRISGYAGAPFNAPPVWLP